MKKLFLFILGSLFIITGIFNMTDGSWLPLISILIGVLVLRTAFKLEEIRKEKNEIKGLNNDTRSSLQTIVVGHNMDERRRILQSIYQELSQNSTQEYYKSMNQNGVTLAKDKKIYKHSTYSIEGVSLIKEFDEENKFNAIKVIINNQFLRNHHIGYIPQEHTYRTHQLMAENEKIEVKGEIVGGEYKTIDDKDRIIKGVSPYQLNITI